MLTKNNMHFDVRRLMLMSYDILGKYPEINMQIHRISDTNNSPRLLLTTLSVKQWFFSNPARTARIEIEFKTFKLCATVHTCPMYLHVLYKNQLTVPVASARPQRGTLSCRLRPTKAKNKNGSLEPPVRS